MVRRRHPRVRCPEAARCCCGATSRRPKGAGGAVFRWGRVAAGGGALPPPASSSSRGSGPGHAFSEFGLNPLGLARDFVRRSTPSPLATRPLAACPPARNKRPAPAVATRRPALPRRPRMRRQPALAPPRAPRPGRPQQQQQQHPPHLLPRPSIHLLLFWLLQRCCILRFVLLSFCSVSEFSCYMSGTASIVQI